MRSATRLKTIKDLKDHDSVMAIKEVKKLLGPKYKHTPNERVEHISMRIQLKTSATSQQVSATVYLSVLSRYCNSPGIAPGSGAGEGAVRSCASSHQCILLAVYG